MEDAEEKEERDVVHCSPSLRYDASVRLKE